MIKLGVINKNPKFLEEFSSYFGNKPYIRELVTFSSKAEVRNYLHKKNSIDYLFMDYGSTGESCLSFIEELKSKNRHTEIIIISDSYTKECVIKAFVAGSSGFLPSNLSFEDLENHLRNIIKGGAAITPGIAKELIAYFNPGPKKITNATLNEKEHKIIRLMADGHNYRSIAGIMNVSGHSVRYYMKQIYKKMNVKSKGEAIKKYLLYSRE